MKLLDELSARRRFGMKPGLESIRRICEALGNPEQKLRGVIHIAGTNGKGATAAIIDACLRAAGRTTGRYTSPHLVRINERFCLNGLPVDDSKLNEIVALVPTNCDLTFFEYLTAVAFVLYANERPDNVILETGLGGRLDATNVCAPELCVITKIGLDHCDWLGNTILKIAEEKAGIIKPGTTVVVGKNCQEAIEVFHRRAKEVGAPFVYAPDVASEDEIPADFSLCGSFNRENAVTALAALRTFGVADGEMMIGFARVNWPGRFQPIGRFIVDGAHNPPAAIALRTALAEVIGETRDQNKVMLIAGFCGDKDVDGVLRILQPLVSSAIAVKTSNPRSLTAEHTAKLMRNAGIDAKPAASLREAIDWSSGRTLICGSLFLAGEALVELGRCGAQLGEIDPSELLKTAIR